MRVFFNKISMSIATIGLLMGVTAFAKGTYDLSKDPKYKSPAEAKAALDWVVKDVEKNVLSMASAVEFYSNAVKQNAQQSVAALAAVAKPAMVSKKDKALSSVLKSHTDKHKHVAAVYSLSGGKLSVIASSGKVSGVSQSVQKAIVSGRQASHATWENKKHVYNFFHPVKSGSKVVGALQVAVDFTKGIDALRVLFQEKTFGKKGYAFMIKSTGSQNGVVVIHPKNEGKNVLSKKDTYGKLFVKEMMSVKDQGTVKYYKVTKKGPDPRLKVVTVKRNPEFGVIIVGGSFTDEWKTMPGQS